MILEPVVVYPDMVSNIKSGILLIVFVKTYGIVPEQTIVNQPKITIK
jgi:hypothetical protein